MKPDENQIETATDHGREMAMRLTEKAVTTAKTPEQMAMQLEILYRAAIHILALRVFNRVDQGEATADNALAEVFQDVRDEFDTAVAEGEPETLAGPGVQ